MQVAKYTARELYQEYLHSLLDDLKDLSMSNEEGRYWRVKAQSIVHFFKSFCLIAPDGPEQIAVIEDGGSFEAMQEHDKIQKFIEAHAYVLYRGDWSMIFYRRGEKYAQMSIEQRLDKKLICTMETF